MALVAPVTVCAFNAPAPLASAVAMHALKMKCFCFIIEPHDTRWSKNGDTLEGSLFAKLAICEHLYQSPLAYHACIPKRTLLCDLLIFLAHSRHRSSDEGRRMGRTCPRSIKDDGMASSSVSKENAMACDLL
jgi:hypothetical protein